MDLAALPSDNDTIAAPLDTSPTITPDCRDDCHKVTGITTNYDESSANHGASDQDITARSSSLDTTNAGSSECKSLTQDQPLSTSTYRKESEFVCGVCGVIFHCESLLSNHFIVTHSEGQRYTCPHCSRMFRNIVSFQKHNKLHEAGKTFPCKDCSKAFRSKSILKNHRYSHMKKVRIEYCCEHCDECYSTIKELQQHERKTHIRRRQPKQLLSMHKCQVCGATCQTEGQLQEHLEQHSTRSENVCPNCGRDYISPTALSNHRCFRARKAPFTCKHCGRRFSEKQEAVDHEMTHLETDRAFDCDVCFKTFTSTAKLSAHADVHCNKNRFKCRFCDRLFKKKGFMENHEKTHGCTLDRSTNSIQRQVTNCHQTMNETGQQLQHECTFIRQEEIYKCQDCGMSFKQKKHANHHQKECTNHLEIKGLKCKYCGSQFTSKTNLKNHKTNCLRSKGTQAYQENNGYGMSRDSGRESPSDNNAMRDNQTCSQTLHQSFYNNETNLYQCLDCSQTFRQKGQTLYHQRKFSNKRPHSCNICNKTFLTSTHLKAHELVHATEKPVSCQSCGKGFNYKCNLKTHQRNGCLGVDPEALTKMKLFKCGECGKEFKLKMFFDKHQKKHNTKRRQQDSGIDTAEVDESGQCKEHRSDFNKEAGSYKCRDCDKVFKQSGQALYHFRKYCNYRQFVCNVCPKSFLTSAHLKSHIMVHTREKTCKCRYCEKGFNHDSNRKYHQKMSCNKRPTTGEETDTSNTKRISTKQTNAKKPITCAVCNKRFMLTHSWKVHMRVHTKEQPFLCEYCGKAFRCRSNLYVHRNSHTKERPYLCNYCGKNFVQLSHVRIHEAIHNKDNQHKCDICGKCFNQEFYLKRHRIMHTDERPFVCFCGKSFKYRGSLMSHKATHSTKRPYGCQLCDKAFKQSCHLKVHILTHGELKPFNCDKCKKSFIRKNQLSRHQRSHSNERGYMCTVCGKDFKHSSSMKRHQERQHKDRKQDDDGSTIQSREMFDKSAFPQQQPPRTTKNEHAVIKSTRTVGREDVEPAINEMHTVEQLIVDNRSSIDLNNSLTNQPLDYRVSPQLIGGQSKSQPSSRLVNMHGGHPVYLEAQCIQGSEFASVHLPHIGTFDFRTGTGSNTDYTIL